jgi:hypothetical protein
MRGENEMVKLQREDFSLKTRSRIRNTTCVLYVRSSEERRFGIFRCTRQFEREAVTSQHWRPMRLANLNTFLVTYKAVYYTINVRMKGECLCNGNNFVCLQPN